VKNATKYWVCEKVKDWLIEDATLLALNLDCICIVIFVLHIVSSSHVVRLARRYVNQQRCKVRCCCGRVRRLAWRDAVDGLRPLCMLLVVSFMQVGRYLHVPT
jgi:hypothetical protein